MKKLLAAGAAMLAVGAHAAPVTVDFAGLTAGDQGSPLTISGATFEALGGFNYVGAFTFNFICPSPSADSPANCSLGLDVTFAGFASDLSFDFAFNNILAIGADIGDVELYSGATLLGTVDVLVADGDNAALDTVSLAGFSNVTRMRITSTDPGGVGYTNFRFDLDGGSVPVPPSLLLAMTGLALALRRSPRRAAREG